MRHVLQRYRGATLRRAPFGHINVHDRSGRWQAGAADVAQARRLVDELLWRTRVAVEAFRLADGRTGYRVTPDSPVYRYLDVSTAHVAEAELDALARAARRDGARELLLPRVVEHRYGFWIHVPERDEDAEAPARRAAFPSAGAVIAHAQALGCQWINLDCDADQLDAPPRLPRHAGLSRRPLGDVRLGAASTTGATP